MALSNTPAMGSERWAKLISEPEGGKGEKSGVVRTQWGREVQASRLAELVCPSLG